MRYVLGMCLVAMVATPAMGAAYHETFTYDDGNLADNPPWFWWTSDPGIDSVEVLNHEVAVYAGNDPACDVGDASMDVLPGADNKVTVSLDVRMSDATGGAGWFQVWNRAGTVDLGGLYWNGANLYGRNWYGASPAIVALTSPGTTGIRVDMVFDFTASTVSFKVNGTPEGVPQTFSPISPSNQGVGEVTFEAQRNDKGGSYHIFDNLDITPEPASLALLGLGGLFCLRSRRA